jgi:hypothetical protein
MATVEGIAALKRRLEAIGEPRALMRAVQIATVNEAQARVPRKTGHLQRNIVPGRLTDDVAVVEARTPYAAAVEFGSKPHVIEPKRKSALAWPENASDRRLSGRRRSKMTGRLIFAKRVNHPGTKPKPYLVPGAKAAVEKGGLGDIIVTEWNGAS